MSSAPAPVTPDSPPRPITTNVKMKMADLARESGVTIASIKFYMREGLLPAGDLTAPNQATYGEPHLRRLRLIRAMRDIAGLGIETIRRLMRAIDDPGKPLFELMGDVSEALLEPTGGAASRTPEQLAAETAVDDLLAAMGWSCEISPAVRRRVADAALLFRQTIAPGAPIEALLPYVHAVDRLARAEVELTLLGVGVGSGAADETPSLDRSLEVVVAGTIFGEAALAALRRVAHEHYTREYLEGRLTFTGKNPFLGQA